jgi:hypothetical protein
LAYLGENVVRENEYLSAMVPVWKAQDGLQVDNRGLSCWISKVGVASQGCCCSQPATRHSDVARRWPGLSAERAWANPLMDGAADSPGRRFGGGCPAKLIRSQSNRKREAGLKLKKLSVFQKLFFHVQNPPSTRHRVWLCAETNPDPFFVDGCFIIGMLREVRLRGRLIAQERSTLPRQHFEQQTSWRGLTPVTFGDFPSPQALLHA